MQKNRETTIYKPTFREAKHGWFVYKGEVYSVAICDSGLFRSAILAMRPGWRYVDGYTAMLCSERELDILDRC